MARDVNNITLTGRCGSDPEEKDVGENSTLLTVNFAVTQWNGKAEETMWVPLNFWGAKANVCQFIKKGMKLTITGNLSIRTVGDGKDKKWFTSVNVFDCVLPDRDRSDSAPAKASREPAAAGASSDGLPF